MYLEELSKKASVVLSKLDLCEIPQISLKKGLV